MMRFEYDPKFIKLLAKEMVKEMQKVKSEAKEPELITVKEAAETLNLSEDYVRKIKDKLPHVKQGNSKQGRILFVYHVCVCIITTHIMGFAHLNLALKFRS